MWTDFAHPEDLPAILGSVDELFENGVYEAEFRLRANGSRFRWVQNALRLVRDTDGKPLEVAGYLLDITNRKRAEQVLREQQMSLNHAQAIANLGSWESRLTSGEERWSDEVFRILGYAPRAFTPGVLHVEGRVPAGVRTELARRGHVLAEQPDWALGRRGAGAPTARDRGRRRVGLRHRVQGGATRRAPTLRPLPGRDRAG